MDRLGEFDGFQAMIFVITLVVLFHLLPLVLGGQGCGRRERHKG